MTGLAVLLALVSAHSSPRPDLVVRTGAVNAANGQLTGTVVVRNKGRARARRTALGVKVGPASAGTVRVRRLKRRKSATLTIDLPVPAGLEAGVYRIRVCADAGKTLRERREGNNCMRVGAASIPAGTTPGPTGPSPTATPSPSASPQPTPPASTVPSDPIPYQPDQVIDPGDGRTYWTYVPQAYDASNQTPIRVLVWLHGCFGNSSGDIYSVSPGGDQSYIAITVDGREYVDGGYDGCWKPDEDQDKVLDAIANLKTHFNIDPRRVVIGGYSSGGDLAYRTAFYHADSFAGLLAENTSPFRDTGSAAADSLAAASWKFNVVHLAHNQDGEYKIAEVTAEVKQMKDAGFPVDFQTRDGEHYDGNTESDLQSILLPHMTDDWLAP